MVSTREEGYILQPEALRAALSANTRMLILCNPSNPTGAVHDRQALEALADVLVEDPEETPGADRCWVMADEIYERLVYDGVEHVAFAAVEGTKKEATKKEMKKKKQKGSDGGGSSSEGSGGGGGSGESDGEKESMWPRTLTVNGFSKAYAMTGYRLGYLAAPRAVVKACGTLQGQITSCASSVAQHAALAALELDEVRNEIGKEGGK